MYKMLEISTKTWWKNGIEEIVDDNGTLWLNEKQIEEKFGHTNLPVITSKYDTEYKKCRFELVDQLNNQPNRRILRNDLALKVIMDCRTDESCNLGKKLGFNPIDIINTKEQTTFRAMKDTFEGENMESQYSVLGYRIGLYFLNYKLAITVDELGHSDWNIDYEIEKQRAIEETLGCEFIRIYPDEKDFDIFNATNKVHRRIKKSTNKSLIDKISKRLLQLEFKSNHSRKSKCLKRIVKHMIPTS